MAAVHQQMHPGIWAHSIWRTEEAPTTQKIIAVLSRNRPLASPFVAEGRFGPKAYRENSRELSERMSGQIVRYWRPGAPRNEDMLPVKILVMGADASKERVYFTMAQQISLIPGLTEYAPSETDRNIYTISMKTFREQHVASYLPPLSAEPKEQPNELPQKQMWMDLVRNIALSPDLERTDKREKLKKLGQSLFDHYKNMFGGDSFQARDALVEICDTIAREQTRLQPGLARDIESFWDGVGDDRYQWLG